MKKSRLLHYLEWKSRLCIFVSGSLTKYHFYFYNIYPYFPFTFGTVQWKSHQNRIIVNFDSGFTSANRAMDPQRFFLIVIHADPSNYGIALHWMSGFHTILPDSIRMMTSDSSAICGSWVTMMTQ